MAPTAEFSGLGLFDDEFSAVSRVFRFPARPTALETDAFRLARSSGTAAGLGARAAIAIGALIMFLETARGAGSIQVLGIVVGIMAFAIGVVLLYIGTTPYPPLDALLVVADVTLVFLARQPGPLYVAFPGIYLVIGSIVFAVRPWWIVCVHAGLLGASYAGALAVGPEIGSPAARWLVLMTCVVSAGIFFRWLVDKVSGLAAAEHLALEQAEAARLELQRVGTAKSNFLARMSHELRTPLNVVLGFADLLGQRVAGPLNEQQTAYVNDIRGSARHLVELVDDVFDLARADVGGVVLTVGPVDVRALLDDAADLVRRQLAQKDLMIRIDVPSEMPTIDGDRLMLRQVVVNLIGNAAKFTAPGGRITVAARHADDVVSVSVTDTGFGIAHHDRERIFEEYAQASDAGEGTGLGLPLARRLVQMHGGELHLRDTSDRGSTFEFTVPVLVPGTAERPTLAADGVVIAAASDLSAFTEPGSRANRVLLGRVGCVFALVGCVLTSLVVIISPEHAAIRAITLIVCGVIGAAVLVLRPRLAAHPIPFVEPFGWALIFGVSALTYASGSFADLTPLAYGFVTIASFTFLRRAQALRHLAGMAVCYAVVLGFRSPHDRLSSWLSVFALIAFLSATVSWVTTQLRSLAVAEHDAHQQAETACTELAAASRHKSAFVANMSHELRTPLNSVIGFADLLDEEVVGPLTGPQRDYLHEIRMAARHLFAVVNDVLDTAKLSAGQLRISPEPVSLQAAVDLALVTALPPGHHVDVVTNIAPGAEIVRADPGRLQQVLSHLVSNAMRFTPDGGRIVIDGRPAAHDEIHISVTDTGVGIAPEHREAVFEAFQQAGAPASERWPGGTGVGLALAKGLVELHGGRIWLVSRTGHGSTFTIALPHRSDVAPAIEALLQVPQ